MYQVLIHTFPRRFTTNPGNVYAFYISKRTTTFNPSDKFNCSSTNTFLNYTKCLEGFVRTSVSNKLSTDRKSGKSEILTGVLALADNFKLKFGAKTFFRTFIFLSFCYLIGQKQNQIKEEWHCVEKRFGFDGS